MDVGLIDETLPSGRSTVAPIWLALPSIPKSEHFLLWRVSSDLEMATHGDNAAQGGLLKSRGPGVDSRATSVANRGKSDARKQSTGV